METGTQSLEQLCILGYYVLCQKTVVGNNNASKEVIPHLESLPNLAIVMSIPKINILRSLESCCKTV